MEKQKARITKNEQKVSHLKAYVNFNFILSNEVAIEWIERELLATNVFVYFCTRLCDEMRRMRTIN